MDANHQLPPPPAGHPPAQYYVLQEKSDQYRIAQGLPHHAAPPAAPAGSGGATILNIKRGIALAILAALLVLVACVIGLAAGLGVSQNNLGRSRADLDLARAALSSASLLAYAFPPSYLTRRACPNPMTGGEQWS